MSNKNDKQDRVEYSENPKSEGIITVEMPITNEKSSAEQARVCKIFCVNGSSVSR